MSNITFDPTGKFTDLDHKQVEQLCGIIPFWVLQTQPGSDLKKSLEIAYGFGPLFERTGGTVRYDGTFTYPGDPRLSPPLLRIGRELETFYQYQHGVVSIVYKDGRPTFVTRMD